MSMSSVRLAPPPSPTDAIPVVVPIASPPPLADLLSEREAEIARHAARGLSNKEIGQRLGISPWTVATHLRRTFLKLDITRRIELCAFVSALGYSLPRESGSRSTVGAP